MIDAERNPAGDVVGRSKISDDFTHSVAHSQVTAESGAIAQMLVESAIDYAIYLLDLVGTIKSWNSGAHRIKG